MAWSGRPVIREIESCALSEPVSAACTAPAVRRHVVISGTGRAGTTFLVQLLTHLGLDTGYTTSQLQQLIDPIARAGLEHDVRSEKAPYIVKSPRFCSCAAEVLGRSDIVIDRVLVPMRDLHAAAESRRFVQKSARASMPIRVRLARYLARVRIPGGLWRTRFAWQQEFMLTEQLYHLMLALSEACIPVTLLHFPRMIHDPEYLLAKLRPIVPDIHPDAFYSAFAATSRPELVHRFNGDDH